MNNKTKYLDQPPILVNGRNMIPLRFILEELGAEVNWDNKNNTVSIKTNNNNYRDINKDNSIKEYEKVYYDLIMNGELKNKMREAYGVDEYGRDYISYDSIEATL